MMTKLDRSTAILPAKNRRIDSSRQPAIVNSNFPKLRQLKLAFLLFGADSKITTTNTCTFLVTSVYAYSWAGLSVTCHASFEALYKTPISFTNRNEEEFTKRPHSHCWSAPPFVTRYGQTRHRSLETSAGTSGSTNVHERFKRPCCRLTFLRYG